MSGDEVRDRRKRQHLLGVVLVVIVALIWVLSGELIQFIFGEGSSYDKPFFLTYYCTGLFTMYLPFIVCHSGWRQDDPHQSDEIGGERTTALSIRETARLGLLIWPPWFCANYTFVYSLRATTVASASTISTLSGLFTLAGGALVGTERFSTLKLLAVLLTVAGVGVISYSDDTEKGEESLIGDAVAVLSAVTYALYTIMLKFFVEDDDQLNVPLFFGFLGLFNTVLGIPFLLLWHVTGFETFSFPNRRALLLLTLNGTLGTVLSDYLWARAVLLTTPLIATLAISLSVPMSVVADIVFKSEAFSLVYLTGLVMILAGFLFVNLSETSTKERTPREPIVPETNHSMVPS